MNTSIRAMLLTAVVCVVGTGHAEADIFTVTVPALEGIRFSYGDPFVTAPVDFGQSFTQINQVTVSVTGTGHTGSAVVVGDLLHPGTSEPFDLEAEFLVLLRDEDGSNSVFFGALGTFGDTASTAEASKGANSALLDGRGEVLIETNGIISLFGSVVPLDPSYVDIQSFIITIDATSAASGGDPTGDGFVGIADLNLVLGGWGQFVTLGDVRAGDLDGDGFVGIEDLNVVLGNWNAGTPPAQGVVIPEPMSIAVMLVLCGGALLCRRSRVQVAR